MLSTKTALDQLIQAALGPISDAELERRGIIGSRQTLASIRRGRRPAPRTVRRLADQLGGISEHLVAEAIEMTLKQAGRS